MNICLPWDSYFMGIAMLSATRSKDPNTKHGAVIIDRKSKHILGTGYNGMPSGNDQDYPWTKNAENPSETKYPYVIHSEMNAILNSTSIKDLHNSIMYLYSERKYVPCNECMKHICQVGISEIVVVDYIRSIESFETDSVFKMFHVENIKLRPMNYDFFEPIKNYIVQQQKTYYPT